MKSCAPISGFERPSRASRAICSSCGVSSSRVSALRLRTFSPVATSSRRARSAKPSMPDRREHPVAPCAAAHGHRSGGPRGAATRRRGGGRARGATWMRVRPSRSIASRWSRSALCALAQQRARRAPPRPAPSRCRWRRSSRDEAIEGDRARSAWPVRAAASTSSAAPTSRGRARRRRSTRRWAAASATSYRPRPLKSTRARPLVRPRPQSLAALVDVLPAWRR